MIGNSPRARSAGAILMPWIDPLKVRPARPLISVTLAESVRTKSSGWFSTSSHWMPMASMRTGRNEGHLNESPVADPMPRTTPKPVLALNPPSPVIAKLRPSPVRLSPATVTRAPTDVNETISCDVPAAPVSSRKLTAVRVTKVPSRISRVSTTSWKASTLPSVKVSVARNASSSRLPSGRRSSAVARSLRVAPKGRPGKSWAPPVAM